MGFKIGFSAETVGENTNEFKREETKQKNEQTAIKNSLVKVYFGERDSAYSYYNDMFDLKCGDIVWVEGKLEGLRGRVVEISYDFKIKLSDYKKVIGLADTNVVGKFNFVGPYFVSNDGSLPFEQVKTWFIPPENDEEEYITENSGFSFDINNLCDFSITEHEANKGHELYLDNKIAYVGIEKGKCKAIVEGSKPYIVEFDFKNGMVSNVDGTYQYLKEIGIEEI